MSQDIKELSTLIDINEDACTFYEEAYDITDNPMMKSIFRNLEAMHRASLTAMQKHMHTLGEHHAADETFIGKTQQFFGTMIAKISDSTDEALIVYLEEAEDRCLNQVKKALENDDLLGSTELLLRSESSRLQKSHDYMKEMKTGMKKAA